MSRSRNKRGDPRPGDRTTTIVEIEYPTQEARDKAMQPGFEEGYEASYRTLDGVLPELRRAS